ncbi:hypothetical protein [Billgrantia desiderata]|uniref:hypothetical protein n=1 Tax=Billgrantia desiderata TaxID=52021 RepID=UPI001F395B27|nr:hypothetical protein [Halomonas desiderata]MCE8012897.1 hypothetical protein [Halomonas desiderata]
MAHYSFSPTDIGEILAQTANFVQTELGWAASLSNGVLSITPKAGEAEFRLSQSTGFTTGYTGPNLRFRLVQDSQDFHSDVSHVDGTALCWLYGGNAPEPWLLVTVMTEPGIYRHGFLGYLERYGAWDGGAAIDTCNFGHSTATGRPPLGWSNQDSHMLFSGNTRFSFSTTFRPAGNLGGVMIQNAGLGNSPLARFCTTGNNYPADAPRAGGGAVDSYARRLRDPGVNPLSGEAALAPITLFADMLRNSTWTPLGRVPGLRLVNIANFDPGERYSYAGKAWRIFPLCRKSGDPFNTGNQGIAVLEE